MIISDHQVQLAALFEGEIEQGGQGHGRELFRDQIDPIELDADGQGIEDRSGALAHHRRHGVQIAGGHGGAHRLAPDAVLRLIHGDEAGAAARAGRLAQRLQGPLLLGHIREIGQANALGRGEGLMVGVHRHDVVPLGDRPIGAKFAFGREVDRILPAQALEHRPDGVVIEAIHPGRIELFQGQGRILGGGLSGFDLDGDIHGFLPRVLLAGKLTLLRSQVNRD